MRGCGCSLVGFVAVVIMAGLTFNRLVAIWQDTHRVSLVGVGVLLVSVFLIVLVRARMEAAMRRVFDATQHEREEEASNARDH